MKKILSLAAATVMLGGGLVASASTAQAGESYPGSIGTKCRADNLNNPRIPDRARVEFKAVPEVSGNGAPHGKVTFQYKRKSNGTIAFERTFLYDGPGYTKYGMPTGGHGIPADDYKVLVNFNSKPNDSVYKNCNTSFTQTVKKKRR